VFLGNGDGTFQAAKNVTVKANPVFVVAVDQGNGQVDLVVANNASNSVSVLLGNGDGTFRPGQTINGVANPRELAVGDFNHDGKPDVVVEGFPQGDAVETSVTVLLGNGNGTFKPGPTQRLGLSLIGLAVGDFNGNGKQDIAVANPIVDPNIGNVAVFSGNGDGTFAPTPSFFSTGGDAFNVTTGDFNGDGRPDLAAANLIGNTVGVLLNTSGQPAPTKTTLGISVPSAVSGQKEKLTATVTSPDGLPSSGIVTFFDGTTVLGTAHLNANGQAALVVALGAGKHSLKATFQGDSAFAASTSAVVTETVHRDPTTVAVSPSSDPSVTGQPVTFTATVKPVAPGAGTPIGTVTFFDGNNILGTVAVGDGGKATFVTS
jgi:hypothetical protein